MDDSAAQRNASQLDELVADTSALSTTLKRRIKALEKQGGSGRDGQIRKQQVGPKFNSSLTAHRQNLSGYLDSARKIKIR